MSLNAVCHGICKDEPIDHSLYLLRHTVTLLSLRYI